MTEKINQRHIVSVLYLELFLLPLGLGALRLIVGR